MPQGQRQIPVKSGQAMIETVIAVLIITSVFLCLFKLSHLLTGKIMLEHAAMRVARARAVGLNDFMCLKSAQIAVMPVAGKRLWPEGDEFDYEMERSRLPIYMQAKDFSIARGVLEYEGWPKLSVDANDGADSKTSMNFDLFDGTVKYRLHGNAGVENNYTFYLNDGGR